MSMYEDDESFEDEELGTVAKIVIASVTTLAVGIILGFAMTYAWLI